VRFPNIDRPDDPGRSPQTPAGESLDLFADEVPTPSSEPIQVPLSEEVTIVEMEKSPDHPNPLGAFAPERVKRLVAPSGNPLHFVRIERSERFKRSEQPERSKRLERSARALALATVAIVTLVALNLARGLLTPQPESPAQARIESQPESPVARVNGANDSAPKATDRLAALPERIAIPVTEPVMAPRKPSTPAVPLTTRARPLSLKPVPAAPSRTMNQPPRTPARVVVEAPSRAALPETVSPRVVDSAPPLAQVPTTGVASAAVRGGPSASTPIVTTLGTTAASTPPPAAPPAPSPTPVAAAAANPPAAAVAARVVVPRAAVESVLGRYASAFSSLDAQSAKAVWPTVNQRNLERAFESLEQQNFDLGACDITVLPPRALALCDGSARYTPKVGSRKERTEARRWTFRLSQDGQDWSIQSVETR
jgi:hypothetical protein